MDTWIESTWKKTAQDIVLATWLHAARNSKISCSAASDFCRALPPGPENEWLRYNYFLTISSFLMQATSLRQTGEIQWWRGVNIPLPYQLSITSTSLSITELNTHFGRAFHTASTDIANRQSFQPHTPGPYLFPQGASTVPSRWCPI